MSELKKLTVIIDTITASFYEYIQDLNFNRLPSMYGNVLNAYLNVTGAEQGMIVIFDKPANSLQIIVSVNTHSVLEKEIQDLFVKMEQGNEMRSPFQEIIYTMIDMQQTIISESFSGDQKLFENMPVNNLLGIPLISNNKILGLVCLFNLHNPTKQMTQSYLLPLHQTCIVIAIGYKTTQQNKEALKLMKVKDEMLDIYLGRLEKQNLELAATKKEADLANQAKSTFVTNLSHEFRTPLTTIMGTTELLLFSDLTEKQTKSAKTIYSSAELLLDLMNDILDISKIEAGEMTIESIPLNLTSMIEDVASLFTLKAIQKNIEFQISLDSKLPTEILGDPVRLRQVLLNFLGNAFKFTQQGYVKLSVRKQDRENHSFVYFEVKDTGVGIPEEGRKKLFKKFSQVDPTITRKFGGTGLGLSISKQIVELMGGIIDYETKEKKGSTFWFEVPLRMKVT